MRIFIWFSAIAVFIYLGICATLFASQRSMIYYPQAGAANRPADTLTLTVPDAALRVTIRPHDGSRALIYFGGNAEDVSLNLPALAQAFPDRAIYLLHYRGYGGSTGTPSEETLRKDALALFDKVHAEHAEIVVIGRSLGSGVAIRLASQRPVSRLVLVTPYDSMQELAAREFPYLPVRWLMTDKYESWRYASLIRVPTQLIAAEFDEVIPGASTSRLLANFNRGVASLTVIPGTGHNTISGSPAYLEALRGAR